MSIIDDKNQLPADAQVPNGQEPHPQANSDDPEQLEIEIVDAGEEGAEPEAQDPPQAEPAAATPPAQAQQPPKGPKRPRSDPQRRIDQLTHQKRTAETTAERLFRENQELRAQNEEKTKAEALAQELAKKNERIATVHYDGGLKAQEDVQQRILREAIATGNVELQGTATAELARIAAEKQSVRAWLSANPEAAPAPTPTPSPEPRPTPLPQRPEPQAPEFNPSPALQPWVSENPWFDPRTESFDLEMHSAAATYAADLERRLVAQGRQKEIAGPEYFQKITAFVRNEFPDHDWGDDGGGDGDLAGDGLSAVTIPAVVGPNRLSPPSQRQNGRQQQPHVRMPQMTRNPSVTPVNGAAAPAAAPRATRVELSADEKQQAIMNWQAGNTGTHYKTNKPIASEREAIEQFAYRKMRIARGA